MTVADIIERAEALDGKYTVSPDWNRCFDIAGANRHRNTGGVAAHGNLEWDAATGLQAFHAGQPASPFAGQPVHRVRIVRAPDGGQLRGCLTGRKSIKTVGYPSAKMRCVRYGEGETEDARLGAEEVDTKVVHGISQFCRVEALIGDSWRCALPDGAALYSDGRRAVIDCKRDWGGFKSFKNAAQAFLVELAAETLGWDYERYVLHNAGDAIRRENVDEVQASRFVPVPDRLVAIAAGALAVGPMTLGDLSLMLHRDPANGRSMAYALMVKRVVAIDLTRRLSSKSECRAVPPLPGWMPSLRRPD